MTTTLCQVIWTATVNGHLSRADMLKMIGNDVCPGRGPLHCVNYLE